MLREIRFSDLREGQEVICRYPSHGDGNELVNREGKVDFIGIGEHGPYITLNMGQRGIRNLSQKRIVDLTLVS
jgi:hypothetical protein